MKLVVKKNKFLKLKMYGKKKIIILSIFFISLILISFFENLDMNHFLILNDQNNINDKDYQSVLLKTQDLAADNTFSGIGAAWNVSHWANRTDFDLPISFGNGSADMAYMDLGSGWEGYQLKGIIKDLYDTRNWINGTFHEGPDDGIDDCPEDDSDDVLNWTYNFYDNITNINAMSGNYFNSTSDPSITGNDCLELQIEKSGVNTYDNNDRCWWNSSFKIPRGKVISGDLYLSVNPYTVDDLANVFNLEIYINNEFIYGIGLYTIKLIAEGQNWVDLIISLENFLDNSKIFPNPINNTNMNITVQLKTLTDVPSSVGTKMGAVERILFDNVSLVLQTEIKPELLGLKMNNLPVSNIDWGKGTVEQISTWNTTLVEVKFNSTEVRPSEMGGYDVEFKTDINLFVQKMNTDSNYEPNFVGTNFEVINDSSVKWQCYARISVPTGYEETNMTIKIPEDVKITWISNAENPNTNILEYCDNSTQGLLRVSNFSETPDGFWWVKGESPNYCSDLNIYNNATGSWILNNKFLSGQYINITGKIVSPILDISGYIGNTTARLSLRFPNGTIWTAENQIKQVNDNGMIYFNPIMIPNDNPNYEVGEYEAIITWNNSYSSFDLNETGIIYKNFRVIHHSKLEPDQGMYFIENIVDDNVINIKVSYNDLIDNTAIENALVYTNFSGETHYFSEISPGFYLLEFNASKANAGNNTLAIHANSTYYLNKVINITVDVVKETLLTVENEFFTIPWNQNFTVRFNYTEKNNPEIGINATGDISIDWLGEYNLIQTIEGQYELTCNTSAYDALTLQSFIISIDKYKFESQSVLIIVQLTELASSLKLFINNNQINYSDTVQVEVIESINITVYYRDNVSNKHLSNATVNLLGIGRLNETNNQYNITIDANELGQGITALSILAQFTNYQPQLINFFIEVIEKATDLQLFLNSEVKTLDPVFNFTIGEILNITVKYVEQFGTYIPNATLQLIGEGILENLTRDDVLEQHYIFLDKEDLKIGVNLFTVVARATNYQIKTINPIITLNRIRTLINITSQINAEPGDDITLEVVLNDFDFGGTIKNATVTYIWAYGQGELEEMDNTGIYEIVLENVPEGVFTITISAFKGVEYDFESNEITLIVSSPVVQPEPDLSWLIYILVGGIAGLVMVFTLYQTHYKYPLMVRKIRKLRRNIKKGKKAKPTQDITSREDLVKAHLESNVETIQLKKKPKME